MNEISLFAAIEFAFSFRNQVVNEVGPDREVHLTYRLLLLLLNDHINQIFSSCLHIKVSSSITSFRPQTQMSPPQILTNVYSKVTFTHIVILSTLFRLALIIYGEYHDAHSVLKYTDIDYRVFSDAARFISNPDTRIHSYNHAKGIIGRHLPLGE
jgi:hypothetical protein